MRRRFQARPHSTLIPQLVLAGTASLNSKLGELLGGLCGMNCAPCTGLKKCNRRSAGVKGAA